jgi:hypothetical protein
METIYLIILIPVTVLCSILIFTTINLLKKQEKAESIIQKYEEHIKLLDEHVKFIDKRIEEIDSRGTFKSDDEVGFFFERLKILNQMLKIFKI